MLNVCCVSTEVWMYGEVGDERRFLHIFKERLKDCFYQRWWAQISNSERFNLYHCFKSTLQCKRYLRCMQSLCTIQDGCVKDKLSPTTFLCCFRPTQLPLLYYIDRRWVPYVVQMPSVRRLENTILFWNKRTNWLTKGAVYTNPLFSQW